VLAENQWPPSHSSRRKVGGEVQEGQRPSWAELRSNSAACERSEQALYL